MNDNYVWSESSTESGRHIPYLWVIHQYLLLTVYTIQLFSLWTFCTHYLNKFSSNISFGTVYYDISIGMYLFRYFSLYQLAEPSLNVTWSSHMDVIILGLSIPLYLYVVSYNIGIVALSFLIVFYLLHEQVLFTLWIH